MAETSDTLTVLGTLVTINCTLQKIQKQSVSLLSPLSTFTCDPHLITPLLQDYLQGNITALRTTTHNISVSQT